MNQESIINLFKTLPYSSYQKFGVVSFAISTHEQQIVTSINGEVETINTANKGDYVIVGASGESYVVTPTKFNKIYTISAINPDMTGTAIVLPQPRYAVEYTGEPFSFEAAWGEQMICNTGDYLVAPQDLTEVYRIERETFLKTYEPC